MVRKLIAAVAVSAVAAVTAAGPAEAWHRDPKPTIAGVLAKSGGSFDRNPFDYDILLTAADAAGLVGALDDEAAGLTVFAPDDGAFVRTARSLGYAGHSEAGAWDFLVATLTTLGGGNPIPTLTNVLLYHVTPGVRGPVSVVLSDSLPTLLGETIDVKFLKLVDKDPDLQDPYLFVPGINKRASNGVIHTITRVLIPVDLP
jgi:uncharacterized surface protein with fasciclin (FAS1) repeats